jgi:putative phage-type endonuclease
MFHEKVRAVLARPRIMQHTPRWFQERKLRLTASDWAAALGQNKYSSPSKVFAAKTGQGAAFTGNVATQWGSDHENMAACAYTAATKIELVEEDIGLLVHPLYNELACSPDRIAKFHPIAIEIKCPYRRKIVPGEVPQMYMPQIQGQMEICDLDVCHFIQFVPATLQTRGTIDIVEIQRDREWFETARPQLQAFWSSVVKFYDEAGVAIGDLVGPETKKKQTLDLTTKCSIVRDIEPTAAVKHEHDVRVEERAAQTPQDVQYFIDLKQYDVTMSFYSPNDTKEKR